MSSQSVIYEKTVKNSGRQDTDWCLTSERRLFQKLIHHKPVGINRHFNIDMLVMYMNNIFDYEEDINFEDFLCESDLERLKHRRLEGKQDERKPMAFSPSYAIRPTIEEKLNEYYDMELIQENESPSEELEKIAVFELPTEYQYKEEMAPR
uniref:Uncharacterized protein n=1 Tax=Globodera rostochiensis TaxID=31243 RepID=A0A914HGF5_GLORO